MSKPIWVAVFALTAVFFLVLGVVEHFRRQRRLNQTLQATSRLLNQGGEGTSLSLESTALGGLIEARFANVSGTFLGKPLVAISVRLADYGINAGPGRLLLVMAVLVVFGGALAELFASAFVLGFLGTLLVEMTLAFFLLRQPSAMNPRRLTQQLPRVLELMSNSLAGGQSLSDACVRVAQDMSDPMKSVFWRVVAAINSGRSPDEALEDMALRLNVPDLSLVVITIKMISQTAANLLPQALSDLAAISRQKQSLSQKIAGATVQSRVSATVMTFIGPVFIVATYLMSPEYMGSLFSTTAGRWIFALSLLWLVCGWVVIRLVTRVRL